MKIADFCAELDQQLAGCAPAERLPLVSQKLSKAYRVTADDVAVFNYDAQREELTFSWPLKLTRSGSIPLNARSSLVARTLREKKAFLDNRFSKSAHGAIFEAFSGGNPIQKIISVPLLNAEVEKGVVQISRKGAEAKDAGADFSQGELNALQQIAAVLARYL